MNIILIISIIFRNLLVNLSELDGTPTGNGRKGSVDEKNSSTEHVAINPVRPVTANDMQDLESTLNLLKPKSDDISRALLILYPAGLQDGALAIPHKYISLPVKIDEIDTSLPLIDCLRQLEILPHVVPLAMILRLLNSVVLQGFNVLGLEHILHLLACCIVYRSRIEPFDKASQSILQPFENVIDMSDKPLIPGLSKNNKILYESKKSLSNDESNKKLSPPRILIPENPILSLSPPPKKINDDSKTDSKLASKMTNESLDSSKSYQKPLHRPTTAIPKKSSIANVKSPHGPERPKSAAVSEKPKPTIASKLKVVSSPAKKPPPQIKSSQSVSKTGVFDRLINTTTVASRALLASASKATDASKPTTLSKPAPQTLPRPKVLKSSIEKKSSSSNIVDDSSDHIQWADLMKETSSFPAELKDKLKDLSDADPDAFKSNNELEENFLIPAFTRAATSQAPLRKATRNSLMSPISMTDPEVANAPPKVQEIIKNLNEKINKLYNWHLVEIDLVSRQQAQLNEMKSEINNTKAKVASVSTLISTVNSTPGTPQLYGSRSFQSVSPLVVSNTNFSSNYSTSIDRNAKAPSNNNDDESSSNDQFTPNSKNPFFNKNSEKKLSRTTSLKLSHNASSHSLHGSVSKDQLRDALSRSLETLQSSEANSEEIKILNELLTKLDVSNDEVKAPEVVKEGVDTTAAALIEAGFEPNLTLWLKELEDELAAAQLALSNLFDLTELVTFETQEKVFEFEKQLRELNMFSPFPLPPDVAACFISLPEEMVLKYNYYFFIY